MRRGVYIRFEKLELESRVVEHERVLLLLVVQLDAVEVASLQKRFGLDLGKPCTLRGEETVPTNRTLNQ